MPGNFVNILLILVVVFVIYVFTKQVFNFLFRGFAPFIISRPWAIEQMMKEVDKFGLKENSTFYSIGSGRSGFLYALEKKFPKSRLFGVEDSAWTAFLSWAQLKLKGSRIVVLNQKESRRIDFSEADLVYLKLDVVRLRDIDSKIKFECKPGAFVLSNGFNVSILNPKKIVQLDDRKGKFSFLSKNRNLFKSKSKQSKKENNVYIYEI